MAGRVYRRPPPIRRRRFVAFTFAASRPAEFVRRTDLRGRLRRRPRIRVRRLSPLGVAAAAPAGMPPALRRAGRPARPPALRARRVQPPQTFTAPAAPGQGHVVSRLLKAVLRIRRQFQMRLRWKPLEEIPPIIAPEARTEVSPKGRITSCGAVRGQIVAGGG